MTSGVPIDYSAEIGRLEVVSRERALSVEESRHLESLIRHEPRRGGHSIAPRPADTPPPTNNHSIEAGDRIRRRDAEESNKVFVKALERYFRRGGRA